MHTCSSFVSLSFFMPAKNRRKDSFVRITKAWDVRCDDARRGRSVAGRQTGYMLVHKKITTRYRLVLRFSRVCNLTDWLPTWHVLRLLAQQGHELSVGLEVGLPLHVRAYVRVQQHTHVRPASSVHQSACSNHSVQQSSVQQLACSNPACSN